MSVQSELLAAPQVPLRYLVRFNPRPTAMNRDESCYLPMEAISEFGAVDSTRMRPTAELAQGYSFIADGDVAYAKVTPCFENGKGLRAARLPGGYAFATTEITVMRPSRELDSRYLAWVLQSQDFREPGEAHMSGAGGLKRVPESYAARYRVPHPRVDVQRAIADYLDRETAQIDAFIAKNEELITLLTERRFAGITSAVEAARAPAVALRHITSVLDCKHVTAEPADDDDSLAVASVREVADRSVGVEDARRTTADSFKNLGEGGRTLRAWDLLVCRNTSVGKISIVPPGIEPTVMGQDVSLIRTPDADRNIARFLYYVLTSAVGVDGFEQASIGSTFKRINVDDIKSLRVPNVDSKTAERIADDLDAMTSRVDAAIATAERGVVLARERRAALISAAVTGKIDVGVPT